MPKKSAPKKKWPGIDPASPEHATRSHALKLRERLQFSSEGIKTPDYVYVAWIDLMGAGNLMSTSVHKAANAIARIHLAVHYAKVDHKFSGRMLAINDGVFITSASKAEIMSVVRTALLHLIGNFIARPNNSDRFLAKGAIAYGPVFFGEQLASQLETTHVRSGAVGVFQQVMFGPAIIGAYLSEQGAPPYGIAVHESARAFAPSGSGPFRSLMWRWWQPNDDRFFPDGTPGPVLPLKKLFVEELKDYLEFMKATAIFHGIDADKIDLLRKRSEQYFLDGSSVQEGDDEEAL